MRKIAVALLLGMLAYWPAVALAEDASIAEQIEKANTPADHAAIAKYFHAEAATARQRASVHDEMAKSYARHEKGVQAGEMRQHCSKLSQNDASSVKEYEALAKLHEDLAKSSK